MSNRYDRVKDLVEQGRSLHHIARELGLSYQGAKSLVRRAYGYKECKRSNEDKWHLQPIRNLEHVAEIVGIPRKEVWRIEQQAFRKVAKALAKRAN